MPEAAHRVAPFTNNRLRVVYISVDFSLLHQPCLDFDTIKHFLIRYQDACRWGSRTKSETDHVGVFTPLIAGYYYFKLMSIAGAVMHSQLFKHLLKYGTTYMALIFLFIECSSINIANANSVSSKLIIDRGVAVIVPPYFPHMPQSFDLAKYIRILDANSPVEGRDDYRRDLEERYITSPDQSNTNIISPPTGSSDKTSSIGTDSINDKYPDAIGRSFSDDSDESRRKSGNKHLEILYQVLNIVDTGQTLSCIHSHRCHENNPFIGRNPSDAKLIGIKTAAAVFHYVIYRITEPNSRATRLFEYVTVAIQGGAVIWNAAIRF